MAIIKTSVPTQPELFAQDAGRKNCQQMVLYLKKRSKYTLRARRSCLQECRTTPIPNRNGKRALLEAISRTSVARPHERAFMVPGLKEGRPQGTRQKAMPRFSKYCWWYSSAG